MSVIKLKNKKITEVTLDMENLPVKDLRKIFTEKDDDKKDAIVCQTLNIDVKQLQSLSYADYRRITKEFWAYVGDPLKDEAAEVPNSQSESTTI